MADAKDYILKFGDHEIPLSDAESGSVTIPIDDSPTWDPTDHVDTLLTSHIEVIATHVDLGEPVIVDPGTLPRDGWPPCANCGSRDGWIGVLQDHDVFHGCADCDWQTSAPGLAYDCSACDGAGQDPDVPFAKRVKACQHCGGYGFVLDAAIRGDEE